MFRDGRCPVVHDLKILPEYFVVVDNMQKSFEVRKDDRNFNIGDLLVLREWQPIDGYSGRSIKVRITYVYRGDLCKEGYCVIGF